VSPTTAAFLSVAGVSLISLLGVVTLHVSTSRLRAWLLPLVALAAGAMLGDAFLHLLPEAVEALPGREGLRTLFATVLGGMFAFFLLEKIWQHSHEPCDEDHVHPIGRMNLLGDALHNFVDGVLIAGAYLGGGLDAGLTVTVAVMLHEIPQEMGDFAILCHAGYTPRKALIFNLLSALVAVLGAAFVVLLGDHVEGLADRLVPFTAGAFIYIAASDLIPEIRKEERTGKAWGLVGAFCVGIAVMLLLALVGEHGGHAGHVH
jgi:zinc and cadmium transporter